MPLSPRTDWVELMVEEERQLDEEAVQELADDIKEEEEWDYRYALEHTDSEDDPDVKDPLLQSALDESRNTAASEAARRPTDAQPQPICRCSLTGREAWDARHAAYIQDATRAGVVFKETAVGRALAAEMERTIWDDYNVEAAAAWVMDTEGSAPSGTIPPAGQAAPEHDDGARLAWDACAFNQFRAARDCGHVYEAAHVPYKSRVGPSRRA